jgi:hypothetical protein
MVVLSISKIVKILIYFYFLNFWLNSKDLDIS